MVKRVNITLHGLHWTVTQPSTIDWQTNMADDKKFDTSPPDPMLEARKSIMSVFAKQNANWLFELEMINQQAKYSKARYDAAIAQGFTETQALEICTKHWSL